MNLELTPEFQEALDLMAKTKDSFFLTGKAGTGKSTFLKHAIEVLKKNIVVVAPTGISAINVGGSTIHSFFQLPPRPLFPNDPEIKTFPSNTNRASVIRNMDILVIDEISMVRADLLDAIDQCLRKNSKQPFLPFGGKQVVLIGDLFQLEPIAKADESDGFFHDFYEGKPFFFKAKVFDQIPLKVLELTKIYRQKDERFIKVLNTIRSGSISMATLQGLNQLCVHPITDKNTIILSSRNAIADQINQGRLSDIPNKQFKATGIVEGTFEPSKYPVDLELKLKEGAQIMFVKNDKDKRWINGTLATLHKIGPEGIQAQLEDGTIHTLEPATWENITYHYNRKERKVEQKVLGSFKQFPIKLAWAITIHKSQGLTFDRVHIDMGAGAFAGGQTYVALSRCRSLEGLSFQTPLRSTDIFIDQELREFISGENSVTIEES